LFENAKLGGKSQREHQSIKALFIQIKYR